jgi:hypothetical protein
MRRDRDDLFRFIARRDVDQVERIDLWTLVDRPSGPWGYSRTDACRRLAQNHGMIASFSRGLLEELRHSMSETTFNTALAQAVDEIYTASTVKV